MQLPPLTWTIDAHGLLRAPAQFHYAASPQELKDLARFLEIEKVVSFTAAIRAHPISAGKYKVAGKFAASIVQASVVNLDPVDDRVEESFALEYWPPELIPQGEVSATTEEDPPEPLENGRIAIGAVLCELLALAVNPFPRKEGEVLDWPLPGEQKEEPGPFDALQRLKFPKRADDG